MTRPTTVKNMVSCANPRIGMASPGAVSIGTSMARATAATAVVAAAAPRPATTPVRHSDFVVVVGPALVLSVIVWRAVRALAVVLKLMVLVVVVAFMASSSDRYGAAFAALTSATNDPGPDRQPAQETGERLGADSRPRAEIMQNHHVRR